MSLRLMKLESGQTLLCSLNAPLSPQDSTWRHQVQPVVDGIRSCSGSAVIEIHLKWWKYLCCRREHIEIIRGFFPTLLELVAHSGWAVIDCLTQ